jgi:2-acylglycerol O-acyltransferase 2
MIVNEAPKEEQENNNKQQEGRQDGYCHYKETCSGSNFLQTIFGGAVLILFPAIWILSIASPILFYLSLRYGHHAYFAIMLVFTTCAFLPWNKGIISKIVTAFARCNCRYYTQCTTVFESSSSLPSPTVQTSKPRFYAIHPHGAFCLGWSILFTHRKMINVRFCFSPALYYSPFFHLWCRLTGNPGKADKASMVKYMKRGENVALPPGGFEEATLTNLHKDRVYIRKRLGFIKLALQHGYDVIPVYCFGENQTYWNMQGAWKVRLWMNSLGIPSILIWGAWFLPLLPKRSEIGLYVVCGDALELPRIENPTKEQVREWHDKYVAALINLYERHKISIYGEELGKVQKLQVW